MRSFVAIEIISKEIIDSIKKIQSEFNINAKPVEIKNIHFTLQFLGEIDENKLNQVKDALERISFESFDVTFTNMGAFPKAKFPRVVWIGVDEDSGKNLIELAKKVESSLSPLGFSSDKPFTPHVTIFRIKNRPNDITEELKRYKNVRFGIQNVQNFKLKKSELTPSGPIYSDLQVVSARP
ncbi:MAG: RNA 2',3'-cyclic phosphodiesterase [Crenarchaeota archaeon]|mgnify:CR=1 FL=1|nr:MAG: RNA 2',3'-cyclic phosphodiesterase [Thermoproteota archaeon]RDJ34434.1 MAG: RNA 2',3'-cyclic phosphodiesterase [Thermoproteota archaeon]RDJ34772.1 MAG: RNA 2',3'-cyclic phosphodiesterase [Thermoproteota archaeon]RDJ38627.1 MAG: RNA 2',3'-cyclic phosphodiesterase [Thermoproteota archaeon]